MNNHQSKSYEFDPSPSIPPIVEELLQKGCQEVNPLFNIAIPNSDNHVRYDLIDPETEERYLWTEVSDKPTEDLIEKTIGSPEHPVFFPIVYSGDNGELRALPGGVRLLSTTLEVAPYIPEYMARLEKRSEEFLGKLALLQDDKLGFDIEDLVINHNGDEDDDVFFSLASPVFAIRDEAFRNDPAKYTRHARAAVKAYIQGLPNDGSR